MRLFASFTEALWKVFFEGKVRVKRVGGAQSSSVAGIAIPYLFQKYRRVCQKA